MIGLTLGNRYLIERELGQGGIGAVYLARDQRVISRRVVIKVLLDKSQSNPYLQRKFREEMAALALIDHPGVIGVFDLGTTPDGKPFLVIQYVDGVNLRQLIRPLGMEFARAAYLLRQMGEALSAAHEKGIIHRDLKPENIMVQKLSVREYVKLIDFGVASIQNSPFAQSQGNTSIAGTRAYMSPEQRRGEVSAACDIYALGVIAYEMLTGQRPFKAQSDVEYYELQKQGALTPSHHRPDLSDTAAAVILRALSFKPENRYQQVLEFSEALATVLTAEGQKPQLILGKDPGAGADTLTLQERQESAMTTAPDLGRFVFKMCDRRRQVNEFTEHFINNLRRNRNKPQIYFIHGEERECHDSLVERLVHTQIRQSAEKFWGGQRGVVTFKRLDWAYDGELADLQQDIRRMLFAEFDPVCLEEDLSANALSKLRSLAFSPVVVIQHRIHATRWNALSRALLEWYLDYWGNMDVSPSKPQFIIFLSVIYPKTSATKWWRQLLSKQFNKDPIEKQLQEVSMSQQARCICLVMRELLPLRQDEVQDWFSVHNLHSERVRHDLLERIFTSEDGRRADFKSMADVEHELKRVVESIQHGIARNRGFV